jgi:tetratricopeptide (TPR) repeat protein
MSARAAMIAAGAVVLVAGLAAGGWFWTEARARQAEVAYAAPMARLGPRGGSDVKTDERAAAIRDLEAALAQYPSAAMAPMAAYELGNVRYGERDFARARGAYEIAIARGTAPTVRILARAGIGYAWEAERDYGKAAAAFQAGLAEVKPGDFFFEELLLDLARVQAAAGNGDAAIATYRRFLKDAPRSARLDEVRGRLARLGATP